jgi:hypothetical protein
MRWQMYTQVQYDSEGLLDILDIHEQLKIIAIELKNYRNYDGAKEELMDLASEMNIFFKKYYIENQVFQNEYWYFYFVVLTDILRNIAICLINVKNHDLAVDYLYLAGFVCMEDEKLDHIAELILYALTHDLAVVSVHPKDFILKNAPQSFDGKMKYYFNSIK